MKCVLINIWAFSCLYMGLFVPALNGPCSCPPMGRDLGPNPARYNGPCRPGTKLFRAVPCLGRAFFSVLRAGPSGPAQMYTYSYIQALSLSPRIQPSSLFLYKNAGARHLPRAILPLRCAIVDRVAARSNVVESHRHPRSRRPMLQGVSALLSLTPSSLAFFLAQPR